MGAGVLLARYNDATNQKAERQTRIGRIGLYAMAGGVVAMGVAAIPTVLGARFGPSALVDAHLTRRHAEKARNVFVKTESVVLDRKESTDIHLRFANGPRLTDVEGRLRAGRFVLADAARFAAELATGPNPGQQSHYRTEDFHFAGDHGPGANTHGSRNDTNPVDLDQPILGEATWRDFQTVGVELGCSPEQAKKAYRAKLRGLHDGAGQQDEEKQARMKELNVSYDRLRDAMGPK